MSSADFSRHLDVAHEPQATYSETHPSSQLRAECFKERTAFRKLSNAAYDFCTATLRFGSNIRCWWGRLDPAFHSRKRLDLTTPGGRLNRSVVT